MNQEYLKFLCNHFNLENQKKNPERVYGGLLHIMWRLNTEKGSFAIKQLSKDIDLTDHRVIKNYELSERIASRFVELGIPAVCAIEKSNKYLYIIDDTGFLVYPWVDAKALDKDLVSMPQALKVARIISKMHCIELKFEAMEEPEFDVHANDKLVALANMAKKKNLLFASALMESLTMILEMNKNYHNAIVTLKDHTVFSHGDLDPKNVLWDKSQNPILIDWESARKLNPTYEMVNAALDWSGITTKIDKILFAKMISTYKEAGGIINEELLEAAFCGVLGNWINWMVYNIQRAANQHDPEQQKMGTEQVMQVLSTLSRLKHLMPELINVGKV